MTNGSQQNSPKVQIIEIDADHDGQRIDNFLKTKLKGVPKSRIYRILRKGEVRVNKGRIKPDYRLREGDAVRIPPIRVSDKPSVGIPSKNTFEYLKSRILYEDKGMIILNKPSGMAVHGGSGISYGVIEALRQLFPDERSLELVHRLDRDTSGCLILTKKRSILRQMHAIMRENTINKYYLALVKGRWQGGKQRIDAPLQKNVLKSGERMVKVSEEGKSALSIFEPITLYKQTSLMGVTLATGRTHQIRVHAAHTAHPIAGDEKYGDDEFNTEMRTQGLRRLFLHAHSLDFELPVTGQSISVQAPLDDDLSRVLDKLDDEQ
jgi:23S rRNA pseudouridine955/2504/2580 synthase